MSAPIRGGVAALRPLEPGELAPQLAVFEGLSSASRLNRFLVPVTTLGRTMQTALSAVDGHDHVAWLACVDEQPTGIGRYVSASSEVAEIALEVVDEHHGRGLGAVLLDVVTTLAALAGFRRLQASVLASNTASVRLLHRIGLRLTGVGSILEGEGPFVAMDPPRVDRAAVVELAQRPRTPHRAA